MKNSQPLIQVFCKAPVLGEVKTRLNEEIGEQGGLDLYEGMLERLMADLSQGAFDTELWISSDTDHAFFDQYDVPRFQQTGADLGDRMNLALREGLARHEVVILVGTDVPLINTSYIGLAIATRHDDGVVLGPAEDGGYGLVGVRGQVPDMFAGIEWGTGEVLSQTCEKLNDDRVNYGLLPLIWDVDRPGDLPRYQAWLDNR